MRLRHLAVVLLFSAFVLAPARQSPVRRDARVGTAVRHDTSPPLRTMARRSPAAGPLRRLVPNRVGPELAQRRHRGAAKRPDALRQAEARPSVAPGASLAPPPLLSFEGLSEDDNADVVGFRVVPPDTNGDVGKDFFVQYINSVWAVYDKATGSLVGGPFAGNSFWQGFGGICEENNDGDPVVLYDHLAERWVATQFAIGPDGHQCIAVSTTSDPLGSYHRYDFVVSPGAFNDYPKLGVWPDAYYLTANEFTSGFEGAIVVAFERDAMLAGDPGARMVRFEPLPCGAECFFSLQPSHLEGPAPPEGAPNIVLMAFDDETWGTGSGPDGYRLWAFDVDWTDPASSTLTSLGQVDTTEFDANLCNFGPCVRQPRPGERLDTLSQFTMFRAQYRHFEDHDTIVVNHTVDATGRNRAGIRWAELRNDGGGWFLFQTGTYAPDNDHRWMGSIAMDGAGNIALGFSVSSRSTFPSVRYTTRTASDPPGVMTGGEQELVAGSGVQTRSFNRWGDYSSMSVDPVDDCTFWYTQEYYEETGSFDFKTRIGAFALPECTGEPPVCTPTELVEASCDDGLDNDCDGLVDLLDPDCAGGTCGERGTACTTDDECCSGVCAPRGLCR